MKHVHLQPVDPVDLEDYPEALSDPALANDYFTKFWHSRWLSSRLHLSASLAVQGAALNLFFLARSQTPVGSLPRDQRLLARLLRISDVEWGHLMAEDITPLHGWRAYRFGDDVVLGHAVVIEVAIDAMDRREARKQSTEERAVRERRRRLVPMLRTVGLDARACADATLVGWLDDWLIANHHGQRRSPQIESSIARALRAAGDAGVMSRGR